MLNRRSLIIAIVLAASLSIMGSTHATDAKPFDQTAFEAAKEAGKPVLVEVTAPWCPTCKAQRPILSELQAAPKFSELVVFEVDFDSQKDLLRAFNVQQQSTLISFKGANEVGRSTGDTNKASIEQLLTKAL